MPRWGVIFKVKSYLKRNGSVFFWFGSGNIWTLPDNIKWSIGCHEPERQSICKFTWKKNDTRESDELQKSWNTGRVASMARIFGCHFSIWQFRITHEVLFIFCLVHLLNGKGSFNLQETWFWSTLRLYLLNQEYLVLKSDLGRTFWPNSQWTKSFRSFLVKTFAFSSEMFGLQLAKLSFYTSLGNVKQQKEIESARKQKMVFLSNVVC